ncbi:hypothetical protein, variant [Sphaeroforma arctica JP610]|uniref:Receptor L-domain domain-containing protein n=1 Tax=Sphaeroforma arctica JP610 TaxID=667725 RepID=A0A0L0FFH0_9EUKA|nr:hypothetical protein, variant [Sphaeroforma arctica JP610]KNC75211.1 hypothetical protein, variant [Sphaeroforma arctica JP610]|eukprot:XP_014149113.1 hypothetical protein, variant [Sphaeroforma arctica JP610]
MKLLYLQTVLQGFDVDYNPQLTLLEMPELTTAVRVSIRHNPLLTGPLYFDKLTDASILIDGNEKLEGGLDFPVLTTCIVLLVHSCPVTSVSANSLALMTESSMEYNRVSLMLEYVLLQSDTTSNSLISIKDTMVTQVAFHSLLSGSDIILEGNKLLDQLQFTQLVSLTGQLTVGDCNHSTLYLPALYYASNITVLRNVHIENITFPALAPSHTYRARRLEVSNCRRQPKADKLVPTQTNIL